MLKVQDYPWSADTRCNVEVQNVAGSFGKTRPVRGMIWMAYSSLGKAVVAPWAEDAILDIRRIERPPKLDRRSS